MYFLNHRWILPETYVHGYILKNTCQKRPDIFYMICKWWLRIFKKKNLLNNAEFTVFYLSTGFLISDYNVLYSSGTQLHNLSFKRKIVEKTI